MKKIYSLVLTLAFATLVHGIPLLIHETSTYTYIKEVINDAPIAVDDSKTVPKHQNATGNVMINDSDPDGDILIVTEFEIDATVYSAGTVATLPGIGSVKIDVDGKYKFDFIKNYKGPVPPVSYTISDGNGGTDIATVNINIAQANSTPVAVNDSNTIDEDNIATGNVLLNDTDPDGDNLIITHFVINSIKTPAGSTAMMPGVGDLTIKTDGSYTFTPVLNYNGAVPVAIYSLTDGTDTVSALLKITINPVNDVPVAVNDTKSTPKNVTATGNVLTNDSDVDGDVLTVTDFVIGATSYPAGTIAALAGVGTVQIDADGTFSFIPATDYKGAVPVVT
ncbi:MAG: tandem-95 repeat protein, partial [Opitutaceae bacterium]|nr:tandem-95 repeat protein [Cytophagales bacterium]